MATKTVKPEIQHAIKTNSKGVSRLLLNYPLALRQRAAKMAQTYGLPQQALIRQAIEEYVAGWEKMMAENKSAEPKPTRKPRSKKAGAK